MDRRRRAVSGTYDRRVDPLTGETSVIDVSQLRPEHVDIVTLASGRPVS